MIDDMKPGKELDQYFANLIGYQSLTTQLNPDGTYGYTPAYSTTWDGMALVVGEMQRRGYELTLRTYEGMGGWRYVAKFGNSPTTCDSAPMAVTASAIKALQGEGEQNDPN